MLSENYVVACLAKITGRLLWIGLLYGFVVKFALVAA
ncbi:MAG: hypothetical protein HW390_2082 [Candidatus Brocadiaceae bacterium]|nr:hypothetical protein [Candidatus Brocadiaceae bacterium]